MKYFIKFTLLALVFTLIYCGESPYPPEANLINTYSNSLPQHQSTYSNKWNAEAPVHHDSESFSVQSGYEGYLIPTEPQLTIFDLFKSAGLVTLIPPFTKIGLKIAIKIGLLALGILGLFLVGSLCTTIICAFTPICTISFLGFRNVDQDSVRSLMSSDKLKNATILLSEALEKFTKFDSTQKKQDEKTTYKSS